MRKAAFFASLALAALAARAATVKDVRVEALDGFGGDAGAALARCQTRPGATYDPVTVTRDVNSLKDSGEYQDISADATEAEGGVEVVFRVFRKMRCRGKARAKGCKNIGEARIVSESGLRDGHFYGDADLAEAASKVRALYVKRHYPKAKVTPVTKALPDGGFSMTFLVDEGPCIKVGDYVFDGAESIEQGELKEAIGVYPWWNPVGWFTDRPTATEELVQAAAKAQRLYAERGFLDAKVSPPEYSSSEKGDGQVLQFDVHEGPCYKVGSVRIDGVKSYPVAVVAERSKLPAEGAVAGIKALEDAAHRIAVTMGSGDAGLADTQVDFMPVPRLEAPGLVDVVFKVREGSPVVINQVRIKDNDFTKDNVIRREIPLGPGDRMLADKAEAGKGKLEELGYFERVRYMLVDTGLGRDANGAEYRDLVYEVEEKSLTGRFSAGVGAGSIDSIYFYAEAQQSNFDLFAPGKLFRGAGQKARLCVQAGPRIQTYEAEVTEPWLFARELELTVAAYRRQRWYDEFDIIRSGAAATLSYPVKFWPTWDAFGRFGVRLSGEFIQFDDPERGYWLYKGRPVSLAEKGGEDDRYGDAVEGVARLFWSRDTRDSYRFSTCGHRSNLFLDLAGGDNEYWRLGFLQRSYFSPWRGLVRGDSWMSGHVLALGLRGETIGALSGDVPIYNRMFLGGPKSIRGVRYRNVSPMARRLRDRDPDGDPSSSYMPWGGQTLFCANAEYTVPVVKMLRLAAFTDAGAVGEDEFDFDVGDNFAWSVGLGVRIDIPFLPVRLDFGVPVKKPDNAKREVFSFTVGYEF